MKNKLPAYLLLAFGSLNLVVILFCLYYYVTTGRELIPTHRAFLLAFPAVASCYGIIMLMP